MTQTTAPSLNLWRRLTEPHALITDSDQRGRARVLATVSLILIVLLGAIGTYGIITDPGLAPFIIGGLVFVVGAYALSRTRWALWGARLLVGGLTLAIFASLGDAESISIVMPFLLLPVLLCVLLLDTRTTALLAGLVIVGMIFIPILIPETNFDTFINQFAAITILSILATVSSYLRERDFVLIRKRSDDLTEYSRTLEQEARNMLATAQVGQAISATRDLNQLLKQVVNLILERFADFYHAQVFLLSDDGQYAELRESTGEAGQQLLARGHKLQVGSQSVIGQVTSLGEARIVRDTDLDTTHRRNELLPNTRSEMALPLSVGGRVIGALDIQSMKPNVFGESEVRVFQTMADQLAVAIENARLFERTQHDLEEIEILNRRLTGEGWQKFRQNRGLTSGYQADAAGVRALSAGEAAPDVGADNGLRMPLVVRGESVGVLDVTSRSGQAPNEEVAAILAAVADRVALALDSTRLSEGALYQAEREQVLSRLSAELQATTDLDVILKVAAREASRALGTTRGFVHLVMEYGDRSDES